MVLNLQNIENYLNAHKPELQKFKVNRIGVFGSYVRNEQKENSDIDFIVEYQKGGKSFDNFILLVDYLENAFSKNVDLVTPESISIHFKPYIDKEVRYVQISD